MPIADWERAAQAIFNQNILSTDYDTGTLSNCTWTDNLNNTYPNLWRVTWAYDTVNDYFSVFPDQALTATIVLNGVPTPLYKAAYGYFFNAAGGNWWDDFGWAGLAALRAAENTLYPLSDRLEYVKIAINSFCYMWGPGWGKNGNPKKKPFVVPFMDATGWKTLLSRLDNSNGGAPNVYADAPAVVNRTPKDLLRPLHAGGIWNAPLTDTCYPTPSDTRPDPSVTNNIHANLCGIQNTVTVGLHALLALRLCKAYNTRAYKPLFADVVPSTLFGYLTGQLTWFDKWFGEPGDTCLKYDLGDYGVLVRERAPIFGSRKWDSSYDYELVWVGDQGIMLALLNDLEQAYTPYTSSRWIGDLGTLPVLKNFPRRRNLMKGVYSVLYGEQHDAIMLRPWANVSTRNGVPSSDFTVAFQHDDGDYLTGCATFYRHLGGLLPAGKAIPSGFRKRIAAAADVVANLDSAQANCDCFGTLNTIGCDALTPWINRLALLCLAIRIGRS